MHRWAEIASLLCAAAATIFLLFTPAYSSQSATMTSNGTPVVARDQQTFLEANGSGTVVVVLLPIVVAGAPLLAGGRANRAVRIASASVLVGFSALGLASIGLFFLPSAAAMVLAAVVPPSGAARGQRARDQ